MLSKDTTEEAVVPLTSSELLPIVVEPNQDTTQKILPKEIPEKWDKEATQAQKKVMDLATIRELPTKELIKTDLGATDLNFEMTKKFPKATKISKELPTKEFSETAESPQELPTRSSSRRTPAPADRPRPGHPEPRSPS